MIEGFWDLGQYKRAPDQCGATCPGCGVECEFYSSDGRAWRDGDRISCLNCKRHFEIIPDGVKEVEGPHAD